MLTIDGRTGGGQVLRTALSLSVVTGTAFELVDVRGARPNPGLKPQHLAAVRTVADLCEANVTGATLDSESLTFEPGPLRATSLSVDIGTAGSIALLFDAVLPLATVVEAPFEIVATGGTDVKWSPTIGYLQRVKRALLARFGLECSVALERSGFYPVGGGRAVLRVEPSRLEPVQLDSRGPIDCVEIYSKADDRLADAEVAERQATRTVEALEAEGVPVATPTVEYVDAASPGSSLLLKAVYRDSLAGFDALGERGKPSETVADEAVDSFLAFHHGGAAVDVHLADQLLIFLALSGGRISAPRVTDHVASNRALLSRFGFELAVDEQPDGNVTIESAGEWPS